MKCFWDTFVSMCPQAHRHAWVKKVIIQKLLKLVSINWKLLTRALMVNHDTLCSNTVGS